MAATFDEQWAAIFAVEDAIADKVAQALTLRLTGADRERLAKRDTDWATAEGAFKRASSLNPDDVTARQRYALALAWFERFEEALRESTRAIELDPVSPLSGAQVGRILSFARRYDQSIRELEKTLALDPNFYTTRNVLGITYVVVGVADRAVAEFQRAIDSGNPEIASNPAHAYAVSGLER